MDYEAFEHWITALPREYSVLVDDLSFSDSNIARALGYGKKKAVMPDHVGFSVEKMLSLARKVIEPVAVWIPLEVKLADHSITVFCPSSEEVVLDVGGRVIAQLHDSVAISAFVVTIGCELSDQSRQLMQKGDSVDGFVLDAIGSVAVELMADSVQQAVADEVLPLNMKITNRFSPGYCSWPTSGQADLFSLLPENPAGVQLNDSFLMTPIKSVSGIIGIGSNVVYRPYVCDLCDLHECYQRLD